MFKPNRFACFRDLTVNFKPLTFVIGRKLKYRLPNRVAQSRLLLKNRVRFQEAIVHCPTIFIEHHFNDAEAIVNGVKERAISRFALPSFLCNPVRIDTPLMRPHRSYNRKLWMRS